jgi:isopentenyl diphosphate isomerase/L-lactate dehydrogenase-like FMN-dependent dehydrogenase
VKQVLNLLNAELKLAMALTGTPKISDINEGCIFNPKLLQAKL